MSITTYYIRLPLDEWHPLVQKSQDDFWAYKSSLRGSERLMRLTGDWQAIHLLLTGKIAYISDNEVRPMTSDPLESIVMGGTDTKFSSVYGFVRYLSPGTVKECSSALNQVTEAHYSSRLVPAIFNDAQIFPLYNRWDEDELEALPDELDNIKWFFEAACKENQAILIDL